ncbi:MAG: sulfotransferase [Firmicutes bacterium]|nr:sulfotransferase [Bacillota bacterium]
MQDMAPVFVVGMPRSGTTLLAGLLNAHSCLAIGPETDYFNLVWKPLERQGGLAQWPPIAETLALWFQKPTLRALALPEELLLRYFYQLFREGALSHRLILATVLKYYAATQHKPYWGEKTPNHFMYVPAIKRIFPEAHVIAIVRDPRDVHLSLSQVPWNRGNAFNHALQWREYREVAARYRELYGERFLEVQFEALIQAPGKVLQEITARLGLAFEPQMLERYQQKPLFDPRQEPWKRRAVAPIDPTNRGKWRHTMTPDELAIFVAVCGRHLTALGYEAVSGATLNPLTTLRGLDVRSLGWWMRTKWRLHRYRDPWVARPLTAPACFDDNGGRTPCLGSPS